MSQLFSTAPGPIAEGAIQPAENVREMFNNISGRYDLLNHVLSGGIDHLWWFRAARTFRTLLADPGAKVLDLCCGTGDMAVALRKRRPSTASTAPILAVDFSHGMLQQGAKKFIDNVIPVEADALHLPVASSSQNLISSAFGFRNLNSYEAGLAEIYRVLKPGGQFGILECNQPGGLVGLLYNLYFKRILPRIGALVSDRDAYTYLPASVERFPRAPRMLNLIREAGFVDASWTSYTFGVAGLYRATKPNP